MFANAKLVHPENAKASIKVTEFGIVMEVRRGQFMNPSIPILVTVFGMLTDIKY